MEATVRPAVPDDAAAVLDVARESWHAAYDDLLGPEAVEETVESWYDADSLARHARDDGRPFLVADADSVVGFAEAVWDADVSEGEGEPGLVHLSRLYVRPERWGEGVGTALLDRLVDGVRERGGTALRLEVFAENERAVAFYDAYGFERVERTTDERFGVVREARVLSLAE
jgi:ribosomal protein S18 acetylase RimI-like enzyme